MCNKDLNGQPCMHANAQNFHSRCVLKCTFCQACAIWPGEPLRRTSMSWMKGALVARRNRRINRISRSSASDAPHACIPHACISSKRAGMHACIPPRSAGTHLHAHRAPLARCTAAHTTPKEPRPTSVPMEYSPNGVPGLKHAQAAGNKCGLYDAVVTPCKELPTLCVDVSTGFRLASHMRYIQILGTALTLHDATIALRLPIWASSRNLCGVNQCE
eukprot:6171972-Pleurochrysis_carterae.AAC.1